MDIFPAIDLKDGVCVRLEQGDFNKVTIYEHDPLKQIHVFEKAGAQWVHLVDLDGARDPAAHQNDVVKSITRLSPLKVQVGGGIRSKADIDGLLESGAQRVVVGSMAVEKPEEVLGWLKEYGSEKIVCAFDVRFKSEESPVVVKKGWQEESRHTLWEALDIYNGSPLKYIFCTDVERDGMMKGPSFDLYKILQEKVGDKLSIIASGGVTTLQDVIALKEIGINGAVIGRALYEHNLYEHKLVLRDVMKETSDGKINIPSDEVEHIPDYDDEGNMII